MKKIILVLLISLTALLADYVIKKDGTLTKVVDQSTVPETPPTPDQPDSEKWEDITVSQAVASKWHNYVGSTIIDNSDYIKITVGANTNGAYLYIKDIADLAVEGATYEIELQVYSEALIPGAKINLENLSATWSHDAKWDLPNNNTTFVHRFVNHLTADGYINFDGLKEGNVIYVHKTITIKKKPLVASTMPPGYDSWKGATIEMGNPDVYNDVDAILSDLSEAGVNFIRLQFQADNLIKEFGYTKPQLYTFLEDRVKNMYVPLLIKYNMRGMIGGETIPYSDEACSSKLNEGYWTNKTCLQDIRDLAEFMAKKFADIDPNIIVAYQTLSEPAATPLSFYGPSGWIELSKELIAITRQYDTEKYYVWTRGPWGKTRNYPTTLPFSDDKVIYNFHSFNEKEYTMQCIEGNPCGVAYRGSNPDFEQHIDNITRFRDMNNGVPILLGSYGVSCWINDRVDWLDDVINKLEANNIPSTIFMIGIGYHGFDLRYTSTYQGKDTKPNYIYDKSNPAWQRLIKYWKK